MAEFQEISGLDDTNFIQGEVVDREELGLMEDVNPETVEHVYIVFTDEVSIADGVAAIEQQVLEGASLEVTRTDEAGHAIVAVITEQQRQGVESMEEIASIRVEEAATTQEMTDASTEEPAEETTVSETHTEETTGTHVEQPTTVTSTVSVTTISIVVAILLLLIAGAGILLHRR